MILTFTMVYKLRILIEHDEPTKNEMYQQVLCVTVAICGMHYETLTGNHVSNESMKSLWISHVQAL